MTLAELLAQRRVLLCVGSGGVGKTTTAAALAVLAARRGRRTAVVTVDPSKRLRDALRLDTLDGTPRRVPLADAAPLDAVLLDVKGTFDDVVRSLSSSEAQARRILDNPIYQNLSGSLAGTAEYMAVETVHRLAAEGDYDLVVVDTPPARHAVDFLDAPRRLVALLDSRAFAILKDPTSILPVAGSRLASMVLRGVIQGLERFTGIGLVGQIGEFVGAIETIGDAFRARVAAVGALLASEATALLLVTAPEPRVRDETRALVEALAGVGLGIHGVIVNRAVPPSLLEGDVTAPLELAPELVERLRQTFAELRTLAQREADVVGPILATAKAPLVATVPLQATAPGSLEELAELARHLVREPGDQA